jgi:hypothetical protein
MWLTAFSIFCLVLQAFSICRFLFVKCASRWSGLRILVEYQLVVVRYAQKVFVAERNRSACSGPRASPSAYTRARCTGAELQHVDARG